MLAALVVVSTVAVGFGPGLATAQSDTIGYSYTGGADVLVVDTSDLSGSFTVEYTTREVPGTSGSQTVLYRNEFSAAGVKKDRLLFYNEGAYGTVNVTVSNVSGSPTFNSLHPGDFGVQPETGTVVGSTGGDADLQPGLMEQIAAAVRPQVPQLDAMPQPGSTTVNTTGLDAQQAKLDIYLAAQNSKASATNYQTSLNNTLEGSKNQARILGKNAYIRALNNGSSKAAAKTKAKQAVADYYATKQRNLANEFTRHAENTQYLSQKSSQDSLGMFTLVGTPDDSSSDSNFNIYDYRQTTETLVNGDTVTVTGPYFGFYKSDFRGGRTVGPSDVLPRTTTTDDAAWYEADGIQVAGTDTTSSFMAMDFSAYGNRWSDIQNQNQQVQNEMDTLANNTYDAYQAGEINNSDLVDPYLLASEYSAGDSHQSWAAAQLTLLGQNSPENFDQIGSFNVTTGSGTQYEGVLFSADNPASGQFEVNQTYDAANISGTQYVVTSDRIVELEGTFTIDRITDQNGQTIKNVTIQKTTYQTTNVTELKQQYADLRQKYNEIEARKQAMNSGGSGGGFLGGGNVSPIVALAIIGTLLAVVVLQN
nr:hypothetical protein [Haloarcula salina]